MRCYQACVLQYVADYDRQQHLWRCDIMGGWFLWRTGFSVIVGRKERTSEVGAVIYIW